MSNLTPQQDELVSNLAVDYLNNTQALFDYDTQLLRVALEALVQQVTPTHNFNYEKFRAAWQSQAGVEAPVALDHYSIVCHAFLTGVDAILQAKG